MSITLCLSLASSLFLCVGSFHLWACLRLHISPCVPLPPYFSVPPHHLSPPAHFLSPTCLGQEGQQLIQEKPELAASVRKKLGEIRQCWAELESTTQAKARQLFEASKADQLVQSFAELDKKLLHMESQLQDVDPGGDLATVNSQLKKLQVGPG